MFVLSYVYCPANACIPSWECIIDDEMLLMYMKATGDVKIAQASEIMTVQFSLVTLVFFPVTFAVLLFSA